MGVSHAAPGLLLEPQSLIFTELFALLDDAGVPSAYPSCMSPRHATL